MTEGRCDFCGAGMDAVGGLYSAPRASICLGCAQTAIDALQSRSEVALTGVTSLQLPPGSVITTPVAQPIAPTVVSAAPAPRRRGVTVRIDSRMIARLALVVLATLLVSRHRRR